MAIFFKPSGPEVEEADESEVIVGRSRLEELFSETLGMEAITDRFDREAAATQILTRAVTAAPKKTRKQRPRVPDRDRIVGALLLLIVLFILGVILEGSGNWAITADAVFGAFNVLFTATIAVFGLEDIKFG